MKVLNRYFSICSGILFSCALFFSAASCIAQQSGSVGNSESFELNATIMEIDLAGGLMIVAEKEIHLLSYMENGEKKWKTAFLDDNGAEISINLFKRNSRVLVKGVETDSGGVEASEITLLPAKKKDMPSTPRSPSPVKLQGGVWSN